MFFENLGKFVDGLVRPLVTGGLVAAVIYMAVATENRDAAIALIGLTSMALTFWFKDRAADKAAEAAVDVAKSNATTATAISETAATATVTHSETPPATPYLTVDSYPSAPTTSPSTGTMGKAGWQ